MLCWNLFVKSTQLRRTVDYYEKKKIRSVLQGLKKQKSRDDIQRKRSMDWGRQFSTEQLNNLRNSLESVIALQPINDNKDKRGKNLFFVNFFWFFNKRSDSLNRLHRFKVNIFSQVQIYWKSYWRGSKTFILGARGRKRESSWGKRSGDREEINWCCEESERDGQKQKFKGRYWQRVCGVTGMCNLSIWQQKVLKKQ